ncbi:hypothetical protein ACRRTK_021200 [Alexandromys fortis]
MQMNNQGPSKPPGGVSSYASRRKRTEAASGEKGEGKGEESIFLARLPGGGSAAEAEARRGPLIADREVTGPTQQQKAPPSRYQFSLPRFPARFPDLWPTPLLPWSLGSRNPRRGALRGDHNLGVLVGVGRGWWRRQKADARRPGRLRLRLPSTVLSRCWPRQAFDFLWWDRGPGWGQRGEARGAFWGLCTKPAFELFGFLRAGARPSPWPTLPHKGCCEKIRCPPPAARCPEGSDHRGQLPSLFLFPARSPSAEPRLGLLQTFAAECISAALPLTYAGSGLRPDLCSPEPEEAQASSLFSLQ